MFAAIVRIQHFCLVPIYNDWRTLANRRWRYAYWTPSDVATYSI